MDNESNKKESNGKKLSPRKNSKSSDSCQSIKSGRFGEQSRTSNGIEKNRPPVEKKDETRLPIQEEITEKIGASKSSKIKIDSPQKRKSNDVHAKKFVNIKDDLTKVHEGSDTEKNNDGSLLEPRKGKKTLKRKIEEESAASTSGASPAASDTDADDKDSKDKKKKNRCAVCRKKVGLTGFECRCGGLFCAVHRYSDKHECSFDYRELGAQEIRRNNPVVVSQKIHKI